MKEAEVKVEVEKSQEEVRAEREARKQRIIKSNSFNPFQMIGRKYAIIKNDEVGTPLYDNLKYEKFKKRDAVELTNNDEVKLSGYISAGMMNKIYQTKNLFNENHIVMKDSESSYIFVD